MTARACARIARPSPAPPSPFCPSLSSNGCCPCTAVACARACAQVLTLGQGRVARDYDRLSSLAELFTAVGEADLAVKVRPYLARYLVPI